MKALILISFLLSFASCTTMRNAERRHDRIVKNFPTVHKSDTAKIERIVEVILPPEVIKGETIFEKCPESGEEIVKTDSLTNGTTIKTTLKGNADGTKSLKTDVSIPEKEIIVKTKEKRVIVYEKIPLKWWQNGWVIIIFLLIALFFGRFLSQLNKAWKSLNV